MNNKHLKRFCLILLAGAILVPCFFASVDTSAQVSSTMESSTDTDPREDWFDAKWHKRFFLDLGCAVNRRAGDIVAFTLPPIEYLDTNSLMVVYKGKEIPTDYSSVLNQLRFVAPCDVPAGSNKRVTVYYDLITNNLKQVDYLMPIRIQFHCATN